MTGGADESELQSLDWLCVVVRGAIPPSVNANSLRRQLLALNRLRWGVSTTEERCLQGYSVAPSFWAVTSQWESNVDVRLQVTNREFMLTGILSHNHNHHVKQQSGYGRYWPKAVMYLYQLNIER